MVSIHVIDVSSLVLELAKGILHLLPHAAPAVLGDFELEPPGISGVEVADEQHTWFVEVCESRIW